MSEHDFEPVRGLPGNLPKGETLLWQGAPDWWSLANGAFHLRLVALYFGLLIAWRCVGTALTGAGALESVQSALGILPVALGALTLLAGLALLTARTTVYTITSKRIVLRFGFALPKAINIPFAIIESATLKSYGEDKGDLGFALVQPNKVAYFLLWPHVRPSKLTRPQPSMRAIPNAASVASQLSAALKAAHGERGVAVVLAPAQPGPQGALNAA
jgi:hypothetical protein